MRLDQFKKNLNRELNPRISQRIIAIFLRQMSVLLRANISIDKIIDILITQNLDKKLNSMLSSIKNNLFLGDNLSLAFSKERKRLDDVTIAFIRCGEKSGNLGAVLEDLSDFKRQDNENKNKIKQAFIYPVLLLIITVVIVNIMVIFVLPNFLELFESLDTKLPLITRILIAFTHFTTSYRLIILLLLTLIIAVFIFIYHNRDYRYRVDKFLFRNILFRKFKSLYFEYKLSSLLHILTKGDVEIVESLNIIKQSFRNRYIRTAIENISVNLLNGDNLTEAFNKEDCFSKLFISMLEVGEVSGELTDVLEKTGDYYKDEYLYKLKTLSSITEPLLVIFMSLIVGFVVFSIAIPMFNSIEAINYY